MSKQKIWANTIVYNEENFIWFAIMSVVDHVDKILVWDTGSKDKTLEIIKEMQKVKGDKIEFKEVGEVDKYQFTKMRQAMLDQSACDWILLLDGDEVWWDNSIKKVVDTIHKRGDSLDAIVVPFYNVVGDIYHYQPDSVGQYQLLGRKGHLTIRAINRYIKGLHLEGAYGEEGYLDGDNVPIQKRNPEKLIFLDAPFLHLTHLRRTQKDDHRKYKYELGKPLPKNFKYPEIFHKTRPKLVSSPWRRRSKFYETTSLLQLPLVTFWRSVKR